MRPFRLLRHHHFITSLALVFCIPCGPLIGEVKPSTPPTRVTLKNGDVITGVPVEQTKQVLVLRSATLGEITIPRSAIAANTTPITTSSDTSTKTPALAQTTPAEPAPQPDAAAAKPEPMPWRTKLEYGLSHESGRNSLSRHHVMAQTERTVDANAYLLNARLTYAKQNKITTSDRTETGFRWRHNFPNHTFSQTQTTYYRDRVAGIDVNVDQSVGLGFRLLDTDAYAFNVGGGLAAQYREADNTQTTVGALSQFFQDQSFALNDVTKIEQNLTLQYWPSGPESSGAAMETENLKWRFSTALIGKLSEHLSINLRYEYDVDNTLADPATRANQRITSSLGYLF